MPAEDPDTCTGEATPGAAHALSMPLTGTASLWAAEPDVIADPSQVEDGRVWTRARDILPGRDVVAGRLVHAAFGDLSFRALPSWDGLEPGTLWLSPQGVPTGRPRPDPRRVREALSASTGSDHAPLMDLVEDLMATIEVLAEAVDSHRRTARALVDLIASLDARTIRAAGGDGVIDRVYRQARRPRPEMP